MRPEQKEEFKRNVGSLFAELKRQLNLKSAPALSLVDSKENAAKPFGRTAHYDPKNKVVKLYITERHPKDILRSFAHEVVHHWQNENGKLANTQTARSEQADLQYAQNDPVLRQMEKQAYLLGNMIFRDWEDKLKSKTAQLQMEAARGSKKKLIAEGPEILRRYKWFDKQCIGPFIIFKYDYKYRYAFGDRESVNVYLDDGTVVEGDDDMKGATHGWVLNAIESYLTELDPAGAAGMIGPAIQGRLWKIEGKAYIGLWNSVADLQKKFSTTSIIPILKEIAKEFAGITDNTRIYIEPWTEEANNGDGPHYDLDEFKTLLSGKEAQEVDLVKQNLMKQLHILSAQEKSKILKKLGVKPKAGDMPDWQRKMAKGIDERNV